MLKALKIEDDEDEEDGVESTDDGSINMDDDKRKTNDCSINESATIYTKRWIIT